jgi:hypothetical protein
MKGLVHAGALWHAKKSTVVDFIEHLSYIACRVVSQRLCSMHRSSGYHHAPGRSPAGLFGRAELDSTSWTVGEERKRRCCRFPGDIIRPPGVPEDEEESRACEGSGRDMANAIAFRRLSRATAL